MTPLEMIAEWRKGCSNTTINTAEHCPQCTVVLINLLENILQKGNKMPQQMNSIKNKYFLTLAQSFYCTACGVQAGYPCLTDIPNDKPSTRVHSNRSDSAYEFRRLHDEQNYTSGKVCFGCKWCDILSEGFKTNWQKPAEPPKSDWQYNKPWPASISITPNGATTPKQREQNNANVLNLIEQGLNEFNNQSHPSRSVVVISNDYRVSLTLVDEGINIHLQYRPSK